MNIPPNIQKLLNKSKISEETDTQIDHVWWIRSPDEYEEPMKINALDTGWEMHLSKKGPHLIRFIK